MTPFERGVTAAQAEMENSSMPSAVVRAVLTAIREPSEAMVAAAAECDSSYVGDVYTAMIDAMLEEG